MVQKTERLHHAALIAEILGGLAVVVSVIYLALQIADNNRLLRSQSHYNALEVMQRPFEVMLESDTLADLLHECDTQVAVVALTRLNLIGGNAIHLSHSCFVSDYGKNRPTDDVRCVGGVV